MSDFAQRIVRYMEKQGYEVFTNQGELNIVYVEGVDFNGRVIPDTWDEFNDPRIVITFIDGKPQIVFICQATDEPGKKPTFSPGAKARGGIFRIKFGQYKECWKMGFHKQKPDHPALVQIPGSKVIGYRDLNMDGKRTGDKEDIGGGVNHHSTSPWFKNIFVSDWSEGCGVARFFADHLKFIALCKTDPRYVKDPNFKFTVTYIAGDDLQKQFPA